MADADARCECDDDREEPPWRKRAKKRARGIKLLLQCLVGGLVALVLVAKAVLVGASLVWTDLNSVAVLKALIDIHTLKLVANALMYSAGFELAYMLFTPGPDEAIEPLILGLAAAALLIVSEEEVSEYSALAAGLLCAVIALLFYVRERFDLAEDAPLRRRTGKTGGHRRVAARWLLGRR